MRKMIFLAIWIILAITHPVFAADTVTTFPFSNSFNPGSTLNPIPTGYSWEDLPSNSPWQGNSDNTTSAGNRGRITSGDNYPGGAGGMGFGQAIGDGHNNPGSGYVRLHHSTTSEMWGRFYVKYPAGFTWSGGTPYYQKLLYFMHSSTSLVLQWRDGTFGFWMIGDNGENAQPGGTGSGSYDYTTWTEMNGGASGDGQWHCYEFHIKAGSAGNSVLETWIDDIQQMSNSSYTITGDWTWFEIGTNADSPANGGDRYIAWDDFALSTTGRIGPIGGGGEDTTDPTVTAFDIPSTASALSVSINTFTASDNVGVTGYIIKETPSTPSLSDSGWNSTAQTSYTFSSSGYKTLYGWAKDAAGNISSPLNDSVIITLSGSPTLILSETFEDSNFTSRGWYDNTGGAISNSIYHGGSGSYYCSFASSGTNCAGGDPRRYKFSTAQESLYISFWFRTSSNWIGSGLGYHPHIIELMTDLDPTDYEGPYGSYTTGYIETGNVDHWRIGAQDGANINASYIGVDLCDTNENRAAHGCNGICDSNYWDIQDCYDSGGGTYVNGRWITTSQRITPATWYHVEAYFKMNTVSGGVGQPDGIMQLKIDGVVLVNYTDLIFRTNQHSTMKWNKIIISPYIGDGSPIAQQLWIDDLLIYDLPLTETFSSITGLTITGGSVQ